MAKYNIDIVPELDITGNFRKLKDVGVRLSEKVVYHQLVTLINMKRGFHPWFPNMGFADTIAKIPFQEKRDVDEILEELEEEVTSQMGTSCTVLHEYKKDNNNSDYVVLIFRLKNLTFDVPVIYNPNDPNISVVDPSNVSGF